MRRLEVGLHPVLVAGVGVHDVPVAGCARAARPAAPRPGRPRRPPRPAASAAPRRRLGASRRPRPRLPRRRRVVGAPRRASVGLDVVGSRRSRRSRRRQRRLGLGRLGGDRVAGRPLGRLVDGLGLAGLGHGDVLLPDLSVRRRRARTAERQPKIARTTLPKPKSSDGDVGDDHEHEHDHDGGVGDQLLAGGPDDLAQLGDDLPVEQRDPRREAASSAARGRARASRWRPRLGHSSSTYPVGRPVGSRS